MSLMALFYFLSLGNLRGILAAPARYKISPISVMNMSTGFRLSHMTSLSTNDAGSPSPFPLIPWVNPHAKENQHAFLVTIPMTTVTVTMVVEPTTTTLSPTATIITAFITVPVSPNIIATTPSPMPTLSLGLGSAGTTWMEPYTMNDLTSFGITSGGTQNVKIVNEIPAEAISNAASTNSSTSSPSLIQIFFPAGSSDPAENPRGGAEFYAAPIDISNAQSVTLSYSVFFPPNFDWVLAGKLPGLYGGHTGCSGGNSATSCFSTRLMWRQEGAGELYLYAPKDKQTAALCSAPGSVCDAAYGFSVGRGSFKWAAGDWTTVKQTVVLNTPGDQDGGFTLDVNGQRVIDRADIYYRGGSSEDGQPTSSTKKKKMATSTKKQAKSTSTPSSRDLGHDNAVNIPVTDSVPTTNESGFQPTLSPRRMSNHPQHTSTATISRDTVLSRSSSDAQVGFSGIFFSTFFGGHGKEYATPDDQNIWFKGFELTYNS